MSDILNELYEDIRFICLRLGTIQDNFFKDFKPKSSIQKRILCTIRENLDTLIADTQNSVNILSEISQVEDEGDIELILKDNLESRR